MFRRSESSDQWQGEVGRLVIRRRAFRDLRHVLTPTARFGPVVTREGNGNGNSSSRAEKKPFHPSFRRVPSFMAQFSPDGRGMRTISLVLRC